MRRFVGFILLFMFFTINISISQENSNPEKEIIYSQSEIVVQLKSESDEQKLLSDFPDSKKIILNFYSVKVPDGKKVEEFLEEVQKKDYIKYAEFNYGYRLSAVPDDLLFSEQFGLNKIHAPEAWDYTTGSSDVYVALIDDGVYFNHQDLKANIWKNPDEICGNNKDDDNNGYVDDCYGWSAVNGKGSAVPKGDHGTHVAGIMGAVGNNGIGVSGVNWNVKIVPCGAGSEDGYLYDINIAKCFGYIQKLKYLKGLDIVAINASWGGPGSSKLAKKVLDIIAQYNILLVAAAGNSNSNNDDYAFYPCSYNSDTVICVGASDLNDSKAYFSNYGKNTVDIFAPGVDILSTVPYLTYDYGYYDRFSGTSMATPFVTGAVALLKSIHPDWDYRQLKKGVISSGDIIPDLFDLSISGKRLNLEKMVNGYSSATYNFSKSYIEFDYLNLGKEDTRTVSIISTGSIPLVINSLELTNQEDFYIKSENCTGRTLDFYEECHITVAFKPSSGFEKVNSKLIVHSNAENNNKLDIYGYTYVNPSLSTKPQKLIFKNVSVGEESEPKEIKVINTGTASLEITDFINLNSSDFEFDFSKCPNLPFNLKSGESCTVTVKFIPSVEGEIFNLFSIRANAGNQSIEKNIQIFATTENLPDLQLNKNEFYFKSSLGESSPPQIVEIHNKGKADLNITNIEISPNKLDKNLIIDFNAGSKPCKGKVITIHPNDYCTFSLTYSPINYNRLTGELLIISNDTFHKSYDSAFISVEALNIDIGVNPDRLEFEETQVDDSSDFKTITIKNESQIDGKLKVKQIELQNSVDFSIDNGTCGNPPFELSKDESCQIRVKFNPKSLGKKSTSIKIVSNDYEKSNLYIRLKGKAVRKSPYIYVNPSQIDFGNVQVGKISDEKIISIENKGMVPLEIYSLEIKGNSYLINYQGGSKPCGSPKFTLQPKTSCTIGIRFAPNEEDDYKDKIKIKSNDEKLSIKLYGNGLRGVPPTININTDYIDFEKVAVGHTKTYEIIISNPVKNSNLVITGMELEDTDNFSINYNGGSKPCGSSIFILPEKSECTITVSFTPSRDKRFKTYLVIYSNDPENEKERIKIKGEGVISPQPKMRISSTEVDFGALQVGNEKIKEIKIENTGEGNLEIYSFKLKDSYFTLMENYGDNPCNSLTPVIPPDSYCTIGIKFKPEKDKKYKAKLEIKSNNPYEKSYRIYLYGIGTEVPEGYLFVENEEIDFGSIEVGSSKTKELKIYNNGQADLNIIKMKGLNENFEILTNYGSNPCNSLTPVIPPDSYCTIGIKFKPEKDKKYKSNLEIKSEERKVKVKFVGRGTEGKQPFITVDKNEIDFDDTLVGDSFTEEIKITNLGEADLKIFRMEVSDSKGFEIVTNYGDNPCNSLTPIIPPDSYCTVGIKFKPYKEKRFKSKLTIKSNDERLKIVLYGIGWEQFPPHINVTPESYDFGEVKIGDNSQSIIVKIENSGKGILNISSIKNEREDFRLNFNGGDNPCITSQPSINPGEYCTFEVTFNPLKKGSRKTTIEIRSNDRENKKVKIRLRGKGLATYGKISIYPYFIDFSSEVVPVGYSSEYKKIKIENIGSDNLVIREIELSDDENFLIDPNYGDDKPCGTLTPTIKPDDYCTVHLVFRPVEKVSSVKNCDGNLCERKVTARIKFISNDIDGEKPALNIYADSQEIKGKRYLYVNPKVYDFEFTEVGQESNPVEIKLENHNESDITIDKIKFKNSDNFYFDYNGGSKPCRTFPVNIKANDYCTIYAYFKPSSEGYKETSFRIKGKNPYKIDEKVVLTGRTPDNKPYLHIEPRFIDFEEIFLKTLSGIQEVKIQNTGNRDLVIDDISENSDYVYINFDGGENPCGNSFPITLSQNDYCTFTVVYEAKDENRKTDYIKIKSNDPYNSKYYITVTGTGVLPDTSFGCSFSTVNSLPVYLIALLLLWIRISMRRLRKR